VLYFMSRAGTGLFGSGDLDELAVYSDALSAATVASHYATGSGQQGGGQNPTASFTATPNPATTGQQVSFNGAASSDPDGSIAKYEWDLDGNGSYETDTGATATATRTYASAGGVTVGLRVTDNSGATATTTRTVTVQAPANQSPTASFTATPSPAATRQAVSFSGAASSDPDGSITKYEWDLDGNGSYETDTGATATASRTYTTTGSVTVGLRVTDNSSATGTATRSLTVSSAYAQSVLGTTGLRGYWRLGDSGTTAADASTSANNGTYTNGPVSVGPLITGEQNNGRDFDGVNDWVDLAPAPFGTPAQVSAEAWVRTGSTKAAGGYHFLITNSSNEFSNGFSLAINQANRATFAVARSAIAVGQATSSVTLAPNTTHHVVGTYNGSQVRIYVDGVQTGSAAFTGAIGWNSGRDLRLGRKVAAAGAATAYLDGVLDEAATYTTALSAATITAHYNAGKP
jgi:YD repeat-containing protein